MNADTNNPFALYVETDFSKARRLETKRARKARTLSGLQLHSAWAKMVKQDVATVTKFGCIERPHTIGVTVEAAGGIFSVVCGARGGFRIMKRTGRFSETIECDQVNGARYALALALGLSTHVN